MTKLSVNINKVATIRNARGGNNPNVLQFALDCEKFGAQGITIHPRPDERHIRYQDARDLKEHISTELNIEGYPNPKFMDLIMETCPSQVTFVPDSPDVLTSNAGWNCVENYEFLKDIISKCKAKGIRTSLFIECDLEQIKWAKKTGTDRIELYTEAYAKAFEKNDLSAIEDYKKASGYAQEIGLDVNAGHDLDLNNLNYFKREISNLKEVSIGHALICDALYFGIQNTIGMYLNKLIVDDIKS